MNWRPTPVRGIPSIRVTLVEPPRENPASANNDMKLKDYLNLKQRRVISPSRGIRDIAMVCDLAAFEFAWEGWTRRTFTIRPVVMLVHTRLEWHSFQVPKSG